ncbi:MAG: MFS transporter [Dehalococcoidia bacterium]|nr:MFS transporter [Dehalococcoidia bacterium]
MVRARESGPSSCGAPTGGSRGCAGTAASPAASKTSRRVTRLELAACVALGVIGVYSTSFGPAMSILARDFGVSLDRAGLLLTVLFLGSIVASAGVAVRLHRFDPRLFTGAGLLLVAAGTAGIALAPDWQAALASVAVTGLGGGLMDAGAHTIVARVSLDVARGINRLNVLRRWCGRGAAPLRRCTRHRWRRPAAGLPGDCRACGGFRGTHVDRRPDRAGCVAGCRKPPGSGTSRHESPRLDDGRGPLPLCRRRIRARLLGRLLHRAGVRRRDPRRWRHHGGLLGRAHGRTLGLRCALFERRPGKDGPPGEHRGRYGRQRRDSSRERTPRHGCGCRVCHRPRLRTDLAGCDGDRRPRAFKQRTSRDGHDRELRRVRVSLVPGPVARLGGRDDRYRAQRCAVPADARRRVVGAAAPSPTRRDATLAPHQDVLLHEVPGGRFAVVHHVFLEQLRRSNRDDRYHEPAPGGDAEPRVDRAHARDEQVEVLEHVRREQERTPEPGQFEEHDARGTECEERRGRPARQRIGPTPEGHTTLEGEVVDVERLVDEVIVPREGFCPEGVLQDGVTGVGEYAEEPSRELPAQDQERRAAPDDNDEQQDEKVLVHVTPPPRGAWRA